MHTFVFILSYTSPHLQVDERDRIRVLDDAYYILSATGEQLLQFHSVCLRSKHMAFGIHVLHISLTNEELVGNYS